MNLKAQISNLAILIVSWVIWLVYPLPVRALVNISDPFPVKINTVGELVSALLSNALIGAGVLFLFLIIIGGYGMIAGAGSGDKQQVGKGQKAVTAALVGLIVIFASYWILQILGVITGIDLLGK